MVDIIRQASQIRIHSPQHFRLLGVQSRELGQHHHFGVPVRPDDVRYLLVPVQRLRCRLLLQFGLASPLITSKSVS